MKKELIIAFAATSLLTACQTESRLSAVGTRLEDLPAAAQTTIQQQIGTAEITDIDKERRTGRNVYEVSFQRDGAEQKIHVAEDGTLLNEDQASVMSRFGNDSDAQAKAEISVNEPAGSSKEYNTKQTWNESTANTELRADSSDTSSATFRSNSDYSSENSSIELSKSGRGGAEALTKGPSANVQFLGANKTEEPAGAEVTVASDATYETRKQASTDANAEFKANTDTSKNYNSAAVKSDSSKSAEIAVETTPTAEYNASGKNTARAEIKADADVSSGEVKASVDADKSGPLIGTKMQDLPAAVQTAIKQKAPNAEIADIDKERRSGRTVYEVSFKDEGKNPKIHIAEDGSFLTEEEARLNVRSSETAAIELNKSGRGGAEALTKGPSANADLALRNEADEAAGAAVEAKAGSAAEVALQANADTSKTGDSEWKPGISSEAAGAEVKTKANTTGAEVDVKNDRTEIKYNNLPAAVQKTVRMKAGTAKIADVDKKTKDGRTVYTIEFAEPGKNPKICIAEDGTIVENHDKK